MKLDRQISARLPDDVWEFLDRSDNKTQTIITALRNYMGNDSLAPNTIESRVTELERSMAHLQNVIFVTPRRD